MLRDFERQSDKLLLKFCEFSPREGSVGKHSTAVIPVVLRPLNDRLSVLPYLLAARPGLAPDADLFAGTERQRLLPLNARAEVGIRDQGQELVDDLQHGEAEREPPASAPPRGNLHRSPPASLTTRRTGDSRYSITVRSP